MAINGVLPSGPVHCNCFLGFSPSKPVNVLPSAVKFDGLGLRDPEVSNHATTSQSRSPRKSQDFPILGASHSAPAERETGELISLLNRIGRGGSVSLGECRQVHARLVKTGALEFDGFLAQKLVKVYLRNGEPLDNARKLFDEIPERNASGYAALIGSYCRSERWVDLFSVFGSMIADGFFPDKYLVPTILKASSALKAVKTGKMVHGFSIRRCLCDDIFVENALVDAYANSGHLSYARGVFSNMGLRDVVSWTVLVAAYMNNGFLKEGVDAFRAMQLDGLDADLISWSAFLSGLARNGEMEQALGFLQEMEESGLMANVNTWNGIISGCVECEHYEYAVDSFQKMLKTSEIPNAVTIVNVLSACYGLEDVKLGAAVHAYAFKVECSGNIHVLGALINLYSKCGSADQAERVFSRIDDDQKNAAVCNEMIAAYVNEGKSGLALELFGSMQNIGVRPDEITYNTILDLHMKDGKPNEAYRLLDEMRSAGLHPSGVTFNILISGFQQFGFSQEALTLFQSMQLSSSDFVSGFMKIPIKPNHVTISGALAACSDLELLPHGRQIHGYVLRNNLESNIFVSSAMVDMYAKCHNISAAKEVFSRMKARNAVSWNILMAGCVNNGQPNEALALLTKMTLEDKLEPSHVTLLILLRACGAITALSTGRKLHAHLVKNNFYGLQYKFACSLIDMYAKCGSLLEAELVFDSETNRDTPIWNSMITSFAAYGMARNAIALFEQMEALGVTPDTVTFTVLLSACARAGFFDEGWKYFNLMREVYELTPSLEHYTCMVAIMGSSGLVDEAFEFIKEMPYDPDACTWATLLKACRTHSNPETGEKAARALFELEPENAINYITLSNIYASVGLWDSARSLRATVRARLAARERSTIDVGGNVEVFDGGDLSKDMLKEIMDVWGELAEEMKGAGYVPLDPVVGVDESRDVMTCIHTEKVAMCYGAIRAGRKGAIRVSKNARMCGDCHASGKMMSRILGRDVFVKDAGCCHYMKDGVCSCQDKW